MYDKSSLFCDLKALGVKEGDTLLVRASLNKVGKIKRAIVLVKIKKKKKKKKEEGNPTAP